MRKFWLVTKSGKRLSFKLQAVDADIAVYEAKKLGFRSVVRAIPA